MKTVEGVKRRRGGGCCEGITSLTPTQKNQEEKKSKEEEDTEGEVQHLLHQWRRRILTLPLSLKIPTLLPIPVFGYGSLFSSLCIITLRRRFID